MKKTRQGRPKIGTTRKSKVIVSFRMSDKILKKIDNVCKIMAKEKDIMPTRSHMIETIVAQADFKDRETIKKYIACMLKDLE